MPGVVRPATTNNNDRFRSHDRVSLILFPFFRWFDGIDESHFRIRMSAKNKMNDRSDEFDRLRCLRNDSITLDVGKTTRHPGRTQHDRLRKISHESVDLDVSTFADDDWKKSGRHEFSKLFMRVMNERAGRISDDAPVARQAARLALTRRAP